MSKGARNRTITCAFCGKIGPGSRDHVWSIGMRKCVTVTGPVNRQVINLPIQMTPASATIQPAEVTTKAATSNHVVFGSFVVNATAAG